MLVRALTFAAVTAAAVPTSNHANAVDIDCKLILCLAGGFPAGCADAWQYLIDRITAFPPRPPIGLCLLSDGTAYRDYDLTYELYGAHDPRGHTCEAGTLHVRSQEEGSAFCYTQRTPMRRYRSTRQPFEPATTSIVATRVGDTGEGFHERDTSTHYLYTGISAPVRVRLRTRLTIAPHSPSAYATGTQRWTDAGVEIVIDD